MKKILLHIAEKHDSAAMLSKARFLALQFGCSIELFSCCYNRSIAQGMMFDPEQKHHAEHAYVRQAEANLEQLAEPLQAEGIDVSWDACWHRNQAEGIIRKILRFQPDMLLHGVAPHSSLGHYLFAPVDWQLARKCPIPVMFIKQRSWGEILRLAVCVDPLHESDQPARLDQQLMATGIQLAREGFAELDILHCYNTLPHEAIFDEHLVTDYESLQQQVEQQHYSALKTLLTPYGKSIDQGDVHLLKGETDQAITEYARAEKVDLLIMGAVARSVLDRLLVGSTMERVVDSVECDVLLVKHPEFRCPVTEN